MRKFFLTLSLVMILIMSLASTVLADGPTTVDGNPSCADLGFSGYIEFKVDNSPTSGQYTDGVLVVELEIVETDDGPLLNLQVIEGGNIYGVIVKGGPNANFYTYSDGTTGVTGLHAPANASGKWAGVSHVSFCYKEAVSVTKSTQTMVFEKCDWEVAKSATETDLHMQENQAPINVDFTIDIDAACEAVAWAVSGEITIYNPSATQVATVEEVNDTVDGVAATVDCPGGLPQDIQPGGTLVCTYELDLPNGDDTVNNVTVVSGPVEGGSATADVLFGEATVHTEDFCANVYDSQVGDLGTVCADETPKQISYSLTFGHTDAADVKLECGEGSFTNMVIVEGEDSGDAVSSQWTILTTVECGHGSGCTLSQGYWKTHSVYGPAAHPDATWDLLPNGPDTTFFSSGLSYSQIYWNAPKGSNPYYKLANQYIAAQLNLLAGATMPTDVQSAFDAATGLFNDKSPAQVEPKSAKTLQAQFNELVGILDSYNNGVVGPGKCDEQPETGNGNFPASVGDTQQQMFVFLPNMSK